MNTEQPPEQDRRPWPPAERDRDDRGHDDNDAPETPPTEPEPVPMKEPPSSPGAQGPFVVAVTPVPGPTAGPNGGESRFGRIARRAHEIYEGRGGAHGKNMDDWLRAEREIDREMDQPEEEATHIPSRFDL